MSDTQPKVRANFVLMRYLCARSHFDEGFVLYIEEKEGILLEALSLWRQLIWNEDEISLVSLRDLACLEHV